jgi:hypothetical protein
MQLEDKQLEGPELEREQQLETLEEGEAKETELPVLAGVEVRDAELLHRGRLFDAMQAILAGNELGIGKLYLPQRETEALEFLQAAMTGRDSLGRFVFAEDRATLLEQALAVLQENLTHGDAEQLATLETRYAEMTEHVAVLREQLDSLEEAQDDEGFFFHKDVEGGAQADEPPDEPETDAKPEPLADYLRAPELPDRPAHVSTLDGPAVQERTPHVTTLDGPAVAERKAHVSTLDKGGPEAPVRSDHVSTLGD